MQRNKDGINTASKMVLSTVLYLNYPAKCVRQRTLSSTDVFISKTLSIIQMFWRGRQTHASTCTPNLITNTQTATVTSPLPDSPQCQPSFLLGSRHFPDTSTEQRGAGGGGRGGRGGGEATVARDKQEIRK